MSSATTAAPGFSNDDLVQLLDLLKGADSVELKLTVPEPHQRSTVAALELDPLEAQIRQVFFFDTPELDLDAHGVVVRARRIQGRGGDSIVKLRPVVPSELPAELRRSGAFRFSFTPDWMSTVPIRRACVSDRRNSSLRARRASRNSNRASCGFSTR